MAKETFYPFDFKQYFVVGINDAYYSLHYTLPQ